MPFNWDTDDQLRMLVLEAYGAATAEQCVQIVRTAAKVLQSHPGYATLIDARRLDFTPTVHEARGVTEVFYNNRVAFQGGVACVLAPGLRFGMGRMIALLGQVRDIPMEAFPQRDKAVDWLLTGLHRDVQTGTQ